MDAQSYSLPPHKRFRILQQQKQQVHHDDSSMNSLSLPAKKRKESRDSLHFPSPTISTTYCLPTKKRVWAFQSDFDLNLEYNPSSDEEEKKNPFENQAMGDNREKNPATEAKNEEEKKNPFEDQSIGEAPEENEEAGAKQEEIDMGDDDDGIVCAICQSTDGDPTDPIVFCDGCDLMVHSSCYGNPLRNGIPEGDWFCAQCLSSSSSKKDTSFSCCLCPEKGGALKITKDGKWAHVVCAVYVPEVFFEDPEGREGIDCSKVPKRRWGEKCYVCEMANGCVIDCSEPKCSLSFHVTCGLKEDLCIEYREGRKKTAVVAGFCKNHTELWEKQQQTGKFKIVARDEHN